MSTPFDAARIKADSGLHPVKTPSSGPLGTYTGPIDRESKLYKSAQEFEAIFVKQMLNSMKKTVDRSDSLIPKNQGEDIFEDMLYDQYADKMTKTAGFGLADTLYRQLAYIEDLQKSSPTG